MARVIIPLHVILVQAAFFAACGTIVTSYFVSAPRDLPTDVQGRVEESGRTNLRLEGLALTLEALHEDIKGGWFWAAFPPAVIPEPSLQSLLYPTRPLLLVFELTPDVAGFAFNPMRVNIVSDAGEELIPMAYIGPGRPAYRSCAKPDGELESRQEEKSYELEPNEPTCFVLAYPASPYRVQEFVLSIAGLQRDEQALSIPSLDFEWREAKDYGGPSSYEIPEALGSIYQGEAPSRVLDVPEGIWISAIDFSPDGRLLAAAVRRPEVFLLDWESHRPLTPIAFPAKRIRTVAFSPVDSFLVAGAEDGRVFVWDWKDNRPMGTLDGHHKRVSSLAFSLDGRFLASGSADGTVILWDVTTRRRSRTLDGHGDGVTSVSFHPSGNLLASGSEDRTVRLWDLSTGQSTPLRGHRDVVTSVAFHPDGTLLASASRDHTVLLWDVETREVSGTPLGHRHPVGSVAFNPIGDRLAAASGDRIVVWDVSHRRRDLLCLREAELDPQRGNETVRFHPDGRWMAWASEWQGGVAVCHAVRE